MARRPAVPRTHTRGCVQAVSGKLSRHVMKKRDQLIKGIDVVASVEDDLKAALAETRTSRSTVRLAGEEVERHLRVTSQTRRKQAYMQVMEAVLKIQQARSLQKLLRCHRVLRGRPWAASAPGSRQEGAGGDGGNVTVATSRWPVRWRRARACVCVHAGRRRRTATTTRPSCCACSASRALSRSRSSRCVGPVGRGDAAPGEGRPGTWAPGAAASVAKLGPGEQGPGG